MLLNSRVFLAWGRSVVENLSRVVFWIGRRAEWDCVATIEHKDIMMLREGTLLYRQLDCMNNKALY